MVTKMINPFQLQINTHINIKETDKDAESDNQKLF